MAKIFTQTDTSVAFEQGCSPVAPGGTTAGREIVDGGTAGSTEVSVSPGNETEASVLTLRTTGGLGVDLWNGGDYVVRLNVTGANSNSDWTRTYLCERTAGGAFNTVASLTGQTVDLSTTGIKSMTVPVPVGFELEGNSFSLNAPGNPLVAYLSQTRVAYIDADNATLQAYDFDGTNWTQVGNGLAVSITTGGGLVGLTSSRVVLLERGARRLQAYDFDGTDWTATGNQSPEVPGSFGSLGLAALSSTRVAASESDTPSLTAFDFDGTDWTQAGNSLTLPESAHALASLTDSRVAALNQSSGDLRAFDFDGTDWTQAGDATSLNVGTSPELAGLTSDQVALIEDGGASIREYSFTGSFWAFQRESSLPFTVSVSDISAWSSTQVAIVDRDAARLDQYEFLEGYQPAASDSDLAFVLVFQNFDQHGGSDTGITPDQDIDTPIVEVVAAEGGSSAPVSVASSGAGEKASESGAPAAVSVATPSAGEKASTGGAGDAIAVATAGDGIKQADSGSSAQVSVAATGAGSVEESASGGSEAPVSVASAGAGEKNATSGSESAVDVAASGAGSKAVESGATAGVDVTAAGDGESSLPPPGGLTYGPWEQQVTIGAVSGAFVRDMAIRWNTRARVDQASFTVEDMPSMEASFDACELGANVTVVQTDGNVSVRFDGFIVSASDERGTNWTQRKVECHSDEAKAKWVRFQREFDNREADKIATSLWTDYGNTAAPNGFDIQPNSQRLDLTSSFDSLFDVMEELCRRTAWAWRIEQGVAKFFDPLSEESPAYDQSANDLEADTLNVARDTRQIVNSIRTPVWIYRTKRKTVKAIAAEDCVKIVRALDLYPPAGWELVGEPEIVEDFAPDSLEREARLTEDGWLEFDPPIIPEEQAEPGSLFLQFYAEVVVEVTHRRQVWLLMESADSIAEYGRREGQPLNDDGGQSIAEGEQLLTEYLARHAFPTVEVSGSALKFGYRRDTIANVSLIDPPLAAPLYVTGVNHTTQGNELQVQLEFASPDTVLDSGSSGGQRPTTSDVDVVHELTRRIIQLERRDAHPLGILGLTTSEVGSLSPADRMQEGAGWGAKTTAAAGDTEGFAEGSGWGESVSAVVQ